MVFVKFGQALSARRDLLPPEFIAELDRLQDRVSPLPWAQIEQVLQAELGGTGAFAEIRCNVPAWPAWPHGTWTSSAGGPPDGDACLLGPDPGRGDPGQEGFAAALREELDFRVEARNLAAVSAAARPDGDRDGDGAGDDVRDPGRLPRPRHPAGPGHGAAGRSDGRRKAGPALADGTIDRERLARGLFDTVLRQIVIDGVFHAGSPSGQHLAAHGRAAGADRLRLGGPARLRAARRPAAAATRVGPAGPGSG